MCGPAGAVDHPMRSRSIVSGLAIGLAIVGLAASIASFVDYFAQSPTFCAETGCATVRESAWAHPLGIPMPVLGIGFFATQLVLMFVATRRARAAQVMLAVAGAAWAAFLIGLQAFSIGAWCKLCMIADPAAVLFALAVLAGARAVPLTARRGLVMLPSLGGAIAALALWTHTAPPPAVPPAADVPGFVASAQTPGITTIVEVVDFECPFCREMQKRVTAALGQTTAPVRLVRKMLPLSIHAHAMPAAIAYCCADAQGKGDAMAAALFAAEPDELTADGCEKLAEHVGCDLERYRAAKAYAEQRVAAESAEAHAAGIHALPTLFIGSERIVGTRATPSQLVAMIERAAAR